MKAYCKPLGLVLSSMLAVFSACTFLLDWDPDGLPCASEEPKCAEGYSCLHTRCVKNQSLAPGWTCTAPIQCEGYPSYTCGKSFVCRKVCEKYYDSSADCPSGHYCKPEQHPEDEVQLIGTCHPSECNVNTDCVPTGPICVEISKTAGACLFSCENEINASGEYEDNCLPIGTDETHCHHLGRTGAKRLVCLPLLGRITISPGDSNQCACDIVNTPCKPGSTCQLHSSPEIKQCCRWFCGPDFDCPDIEGVAHTCLLIDEEGSDPYSICVPPEYL